MWLFALIILIAMITQTGKNNGKEYTSKRLHYCSNQCEELSKHVKK
jgi:hypothetical protein